MFEISFGELLLIGVVALVVLGPERLPAVARTLGALVGRAQRFVASVKADISQQANLQGLESLRSDIQEAATSFKTQLEGEVHEVREAMAQNAMTTAPATSPTAEAAVAAPQPEPLPEAADVVTASHTLAETPAPVKDDNQLDLFDSPASPATTPPVPPRA
ncbi:MAG TPA: Sec-independent protein translocase protein TatB [Chromobacteriaceae bacterium]|nr:Sec-independent protein translocase protein TatB [Chromobacteriaceae bacterium]